MWKDMEMFCMHIYTIRYCYFNVVSNGNACTYG